jgi:GRASP55/65 PDZ-like domain
MKMSEARLVKLTPSDSWGGAGLLGVTIRLDNYGDADERLIRVLAVERNSPAAIAGLVPHKDYLLGTTTTSLDAHTHVLAQLIQQHQDEVLEFYVYNMDSDVVRVVAILPTYRWGGRGLLGAELGTGYLHRLPSSTRHTAGTAVYRKIRTAPDQPRTKSSHQDSRGPVTRMEYEPQLEMEQEEEEENHGSNETEAAPQQESQFSPGTPAKESEAVPSPSNGTASRLQLPRPPVSPYVSGNLAMSPDAAVGLRQLEPPLESHDETALTPSALFPPNSPYLDPPSHDTPAKIASSPPVSVPAASSLRSSAGSFGVEEIEQVFARKPSPTVSTETPLQPATPTAISLPEQVSPPQEARASLASPPSSTPETLPSPAVVSETVPAPVSPFGEPKAPPLPPPPPAPPVAPSNVGAMSFASTLPLQPKAAPYMNTTAAVSSPTAARTAVGGASTASYFFPPPPRMSGVAPRVGGLSSNLDNSSGSGRHSQLQHHAPVASASSSVQTMSQYQQYPSRT